MTHFADAADGYLDGILKCNGRLRLFTAHCATRLSWKQICRLFANHPKLCVYIGTAQVGSEQVFGDKTVPLFVQQLAKESHCRIYADPSANPSIVLHPGSRKTIRIFQGKEQLTITSESGLRSFLAFREAEAA